MTNRRSPIGMHEVLIRRGNARLWRTAAAGFFCLLGTASLLVAPMVAGIFSALSLIGARWISPFSYWGMVASTSLALGAVGAALTATTSLRAIERIAVSRSGAWPVPHRRTPAPPRIPQDQLQRMQSLVEVLSLAHGIVPPRVALTVDAAPNCLTIGRKPSTACIVMTTGMLETLNRHQLEAVLAYELARVVRGSVSLDTVVYAVTAKVFELWASAFDEIDESSLITIPLGLLCSPFVALAWALRANVLRGRAQLADGVALGTTRNPRHLIDALRVIMDHPAIVRRSDPGAAHLWLEYPHSRWSRRILRTDRIMSLRIATLQTALNLPDHGR